ncbi:WG repeat-containing protein [uncultured Flavobacterium sp.]|uniref:WG repeat-containing protein n=1 Tax=uncultured Flavobacterium sp. TaxID=165435 RepID=UPI0025D93E28|nr:WG repeat-containing protein [uncultured Flavobacterium sp.]
MKKICLLIAVLLFQFGYSQNILVPYRVKDKWGLSDINGKLVVAATYDKISMGRNFPDGYFSFGKGEISGILYGKKEILAGQYDEFEVIEKKFIVAKSKSSFPGGRSYTPKEYEELRRKRDASYLFSLTGKNLHPEGFKNARVFDTLGASTKHKGHARFMLFLSENFYKQKSIFVYDIDKQDITQWLMKDYYKLNVTAGIDFPKGGYYIQGHEIGSADEMIYTFSLAGNKVKVDSRPAQKPKYGDSYGTDGGSGTGNGSFDSHGDLTIGAPSNSGGKSYHTSIKVDGGKITFRSAEYPRQVNSTEGIVEKMISLPYDVEWVKEQRLFNSIKTAGNATIKPNSVAQFRTREGHYGIVFTDTIIITPEYTYLQPFATYRAPEGSLRFFAGRQSGAGGKRVYGIIDIYQKEIIPIAYDSIFFEKGRYSSDFVQSMAVQQLTVLKNRKYGIIDIDGKIVIEPVYDSIYQNKRDYLNFRESKFTILQKDDKYAVYHEFAKESPLVTETVFIKPPGYYINDYQGQKGLLLFGLIDDKGKLNCYARKDGFTYCKE